MRAIIVPAERVRNGGYEMSSVCLCVCVCDKNVNPVFLFSKMCVFDLLCQSAGCMWVGMGGTMEGCGR